MNKEEAIENVKKQLEGIKKANECGLATRGEFNKDIEAIETVLNLLEKKDKIIDLMAMAIDNEPLPTEEYCIFRNFDCPAVGGNRDCKDCVKQYFERKVENGN